MLPDRGALREKKKQWLENNITWKKKGWSSATVNFFFFFYELLSRDDLPIFVSPFFSLLSTVHFSRNAPSSPAWCSDSAIFTFFAKLFFIPNASSRARPGPTGVGSIPTLYAKRFHSVPSALTSSCS